MTIPELPGGGGLPQRRPARDERASRVVSSCGPLGVVLRWHTVAEELDWLPEDGLALSRAELECIFIDLRALISGTGELDPNRAHAVDIAVTLTQALERDRGDDQ